MCTYVLFYILLHSVKSILLNDVHDVHDGARDVHDGVRDGVHGVARGDDVLRDVHGGVHGGDVLRDVHVHGAHDVHGVHHDDCGELLGNAL
uniref:Secreted protein n=1 Tax=Parastrongyloides trichosuri TaxID=131310 RepID=A0A0N4Z7N7_PARTI